MPPLAEIEIFYFSHKYAAFLYFTSPRRVGKEMLWKCEDTRDNILVGYLFTLITQESKMSYSLK